MCAKKIFEKINTTTLALAISCVILLIALIVAVAYWDYSNTQYSVLQSQTSAYVNDHSHTNEEFETLKSELENADNQLSTSNNQSTVSLLQDQINSLQAQLNNVTSIENLGNTVHLVQPNTPLSLKADSNFTYSFTVSYSGAINVIINVANPNMYIETIWNTAVGGFSLNYDKTVTVGGGYFVVEFPVIASPSYTVTVQITVGNTNPSSGFSGTVDILYYY